MTIREEPDLGNSAIKKHDWQQLREQFPVFSYEAFRIEYLKSSIRITFDFRSAPGIEFHPEIVIEASQSLPRKLPTAVLEHFAFQLGLIESLSYWKATCSPTIRILPGIVENDQVSWWKKLLYHGMGEFFYVNNIDFTRADFVNFDAQSAVRFPRYDEHLATRSLLPIGGGRDSGVTGMVYAKSRLKIGCMLLNPTPAACAVVEKINPLERILIRRTIDPQLIRLNSVGFLNGHTPFSAYLAFLSALCAVLFDYQDIVIANEHSSNEGNAEFMGESINHQYSKSLQFEEDFDTYLRQYLAPGIRYFSFVRPLGELQIGAAFARFPEMFGTIKSCNRNPTSREWCGICPKCLSVFVTTYPFVNQDELIKIFGKNFFENVDSIRTLRELAGLDGSKPFECVGTYEEMIVGLYLCVRACKCTGQTLPVALERADFEILQLHPEAASVANSLLRKRARHRVPKDVEPLLALLG